jgi:hypothetical protein
LHLPFKNDTKSSSSRFQFDASNQFEININFERFILNEIDVDKINKKKYGTVNLARNDPAQQIQSENKSVGKCVA